MRPALEGVRIEGTASLRLQQLAPAQRRRVTHTLEEMAAVARLMRLEGGTFAGERLHFNAGDVRVEYSIDDPSELITVHDILAIEYARAG